MKIIKKNDEKRFKDLTDGDVFRYIRQPSVLYLKGFHGNGKAYQVNLISGAITLPVEDEPIDLVKGYFTEEM